jgi:hypothetical protein
MDVLHVQLVEIANVDNCPKCGYDRLAYFSSLQYKLCTACWFKIPWILEYNQKPLIKHQR